MVIVDLFKCILYLEQLDGCENLQKCAGLYCTNGFITHGLDEDDPVSIHNLTYGRIKRNWDKLSSIFNIPYTAVLKDLGYVGTLVNLPGVAVVSDKKKKESGIRVLKFVRDDKLFHVASIHGSVTVVNSMNAPRTASCGIEGAREANLWYTDGILHINTVGQRDHTGILLRYNENTVGDVISSVSGNLCIVKQHNTDRMKSMVNNTPHSYFKHDAIHAILEDNNDIDGRYNKLVAALQYLGDDAPDKLNVLLGAMED